MNTFADWIPFLNREMAALSQRAFLLPIDDVEEVLGVNGAPEADAAIRVYLDTTEWPPVSDRVRFELLLRLAVARRYCRNSAAARPEEELPEFLESVLIEYWRDVGRTDWLYHEFVNPDKPPPYPCCD